jgi:hypothetical protein
MTPAVKPLSVGMRRLFLVASLLVLSVGVPLYLLSGRTDRTFAWTISPPLTAAFFGANYWGSFLLELLSARERVWARARVAAPAVLVFTTLTLVVTLVHRDRFHFGAEHEFITRAGTWFWLGVYVSVPPVMAVLLVRQLRLPGGDPPRVAPLPAWLRALLAAQGLVMLALGVALLLAPLDAARLWPWRLTALTARATGAWLAGLGVAAVHVVWENDLARVRWALVSLTATVVLQFVALARYPDTPDWEGPAAWLYAAFLALMLVAGAYGSVAALRPARAATATRPATAPPPPR